MSSLTSLVPCVIQEIKAIVQISSSFVFGIMQYEWEMFANCLAEAGVSGGPTRPLTYTWNRKWVPA